jgi:hypothetical protein
MVLKKKKLWGILKEMIKVQLPEARDYIR